MVIMRVYNESCKDFFYLKKCNASIFLFFGGVPDLNGSTTKETLFYVSSQRLCIGKVKKKETIPLSGLDGRI